MSHPPRLYHRTSAAETILRDGFRGTTGSYMLVGLTLTGVFVSDVPLDANEGASGQAILEVRLPTDMDIDEFELVEDEKPYREWCLPAALLNDRARVALAAS